MSSGNTGITGTEISPVGSLETLGKDGSTSDFSFIRQKSGGTNHWAGGIAPEHYSHRQERERKKK